MKSQGISFQTKSGHPELIGIDSIPHILHIQAPRYGCVTKNYFSYFSMKTYVVGTQKNRLIETVLLSTQNTCLN